ncbi:DUF192 domain-containing protein [Pullulanibacillus sp. KACC 23026]|uniref:DUF192 domain-containing protein n=1 Tax=Pullulanibacillus sp. KACC 23026 TaxID=3028315 RepID=UPI0023AF0F70|nr:DUF192 domain-containing protein [Pullulanibacillus sp. KACC 23026]WEG13576.1 DUF192 domain-containing protein [Pullulanibacillus sp. KACC 23026]
MELVNVTSGKQLAGNVEQAATFGKRLKGLMFRHHLSMDSAMYLAPCRSIHTFFMKFPIDVLYVDSENNIVSLEKNMPPGKVGKTVRHAKYVIELNAGRIDQTDTQIGHKLAFVGKGRRSKR